MKKSLLIWLLIVGVISLSWCWREPEPTFTSPMSYCEENWWIVEDRQEELWTGIFVCKFDDWSYCILEDFANNKCNKWEQYFITIWEELN